MGERSIKPTKRAVDSAPVEPRRYTLWDTDLSGFGVRIEPSGRRTFIVRYRAGGGRSGQQRQMTLGRFGVLTVDQARAEANRVLVTVATGADPVAERHKTRREPTISELWSEYVTATASTKKPSTLMSDRSRFVSHIEPLLGGRRVSKVTRDDVEQLRRCSCTLVASGTGVAPFGQAPDRLPSAGQLDKGTF